MCRLVSFTFHGLIDICLVIFVSIDYQEFWLFKMLVTSDGFMTLRRAFKNTHCCTIRFTRLVKRFNSTSSNNTLNSEYLEHDPELIKRKEYIKTFLSGKPFDSIEEFSASNIESSNSIEKFNPDIVPSPFVYLDGSDALNFILNQNEYFDDMAKYDYLIKYDYFTRLKWDSNGNFHDKVDLILNWKKKFNHEYKDIELQNNEINLKFPDDIKASMIGKLNTENFELKESIDQLLIEFPKYSFENMTLLYIKLIPQLSSNQREMFVQQISDFFMVNILHFHDSTLESICQTLISFNLSNSVTTIVRAYNEFSHSESGFLAIMSKSLIQDYLNGLLQENDIKTSKTVIEHIINSGYKPDIDTITNYFRLVSRICQSVDTNKSNQEMLFNAFTLSLSSVIIKEGMLNDEIIKYISGFIRINILPLFINYLKLAKDHNELKELPDTIINRIRKSTSYQNKTDQEKAIFLTGILKSLDLDFNSFSESCKLEIINLYAEAHSPLAVLLWSKTLGTPLSELDKNKIFNILEGESDNISSKFDISNKL